MIVRPDAASGYELIAGERRWRAAQLAGRASIPALIDTNVEGAGSLELALIENVVREDLTPIEEARTIAILLDDLNLTTTGACETPRTKPRRPRSHGPPARPTRPSDRPHRRWRRDQRTRKGASDRARPSSSACTGSASCTGRMVRPSPRSRNRAWGDAETKAAAAAP